MFKKFITTALSVILVFTSFGPAFAAEDVRVPELKIVPIDDNAYSVLRLAVPSAEDPDSFVWSDAIPDDGDILDNIGSPDDLVSVLESMDSQDNGDELTANLADEYREYVSFESAITPKDDEEDTYELTKGLYLVIDEDGFYQPVFFEFGDDPMELELEERKTDEEAGEEAEEEESSLPSEDQTPAEPQTGKKSPSVRKAPSLRGSGLIFDEEDIEKFTAELVRGADKQRDGSFEWTPTNSNADHRVVYKITYAFSGVGEIDPGDVEIRIPKRLIKDREGEYADYYDIAVPPEDEAEPDTKWVMREDGDTIVIYNYTEISAGEAGTIEASYLTDKHTTYYTDMGESDPFTADLTVHNENTDVTAHADAAPFRINTTAEIRRTNKQSPQLYKKWQDEFGTAPQDADDYYYIVWEIRSNFNDKNTQPFDFILEDDFEDGDVVAYKFQEDNRWTTNNRRNNIYQKESERYDYVLTRHAKSEFSGKDYKVWNNITATVHPIDNIDADSQDTDREPFEYTRPVYKRPPGHFYAEKFGQYLNSYSDSLTENGEGIVSDSEDISDYSLTEFKEGSTDVIDNPRLKYYTFFRGYPYPWTLPEGSNGLDPSEYGTVPVKYEFRDDKLYIEDSSQLGAGDYEITKLVISSEFKDAEFDEDEMCFKEKGMDSNKFTPATDLHIYAKKDGDTEWKKVARYSFRTSEFSELDRNYVASAGGNTINFKPGVLGYRWEMSNAFYYSRVNTYPTVKLFRTEKVLNDIGDRNKIRLNNTAFIKATDAAGEELFPVDAYNSQGQQFAAVGMTNTDYIAGVEKASYILKRDTGMRSNKAKGQFAVSWSINMNESYKDNTGRHYIKQDGGTFYDLCPAGSHADTSTVRVFRDSDMVQLDPSKYTVSVKHNYKKSGRDLMIIKIKEPGDFYTFTFDTIHEWEDQKQTRFSLLNSVAYQTGNDRIAEGYPDDGGRGKDKQLLSDLDPDNNDVRFIYSQDWRDVDLVTATSTGLNKKVRDEYDSAYSYKTFTRTNGKYFYRLRMLNDGNTRSKDIILFDSLENYANPEVSSDFHGTLQDVDVSDLTDRDIDAKVYYSLMEDMDIYAHHDLEEEISGEKVWLTEEEIEDISRAKAVAIDCRKMTDGSDFVLESNTPIMARLEMKAPSKGLQQLGIPYAYNNVFLSQTEINEFDVEHQDLIHQDYTKIGYKVTGTLDFRKVNTTDHSEGISGIAFKITGTSVYGTEIDETYTSGESGTVSIENLEQGTYEIRELGGSPRWLVDRTIHHITIDEEGNASIDLPEENGTSYWENKRRITGELRIIKVSREIEGFPQEPVPDTEFVLSGTSDYGNDIRMIGTTDSTGKLRFDDVEKGTYSLRETKANDDFIATADEMTVTVDAAGNTYIDGLTADSGMNYRISNDRRYHSFRLYKYDAENEDLVIPGTEFGLTGISDIGTKYDLKVTTDDYGRADFEKIEAGTYILKETKAAARYKLDPTERSVMVDSDGNVTISGLEPSSRNVFKLTNERLNDGKITIVKKWNDGKTNEERPIPKVHLTTTEPEGT